MCGIFGFTGNKSHQNLVQMGEKLVHRGPDEGGYHETEQVSLGIRRLAIVDLESGQQPASTQDNQIWTVLNGEIYNHVELRQGLEAEGHRFRSDHSDTEVIPHLYEKYGTEFPQYLNGMFGIALWDEKKQELHLVRDRMGIKPLFYAIRGGRIFFGSEIKALFANSDLKKKPNYQALTDFFTFKNIPAPATAFEDVYQLLPGERLVFRAGKIEKHRWWNLRYVEQPDLSLADAAQGLRDLLTDSVRLQLQCDAPFGAYLSGGIDSSAVVAIASQLIDKPLKTFTLVYEDELAGKNLDRKFARAISDRYKTDHHEDVMKVDEIEDALPAIVDSFDEPFSGTVSTYFLTRFMAKHVKVALSGDGADELFGSYLNHRLATPLWYADRFRREGNTNPAALRGLLPAEFTPERIMQLAEKGDEASRRVAQYIFDEAQKKELLSPLLAKHGVHLASESFLRGLYADAGTDDPLNRALYVDQKSLLPDQVLAFVDRLSMAHSVEVRPPFLDHRIVEYAAKIPGKFKIPSSGDIKHVLKLAVADLLPTELINRPKEGFVMPVHLWLLDRLKPLVNQLLSPASLTKQGLLNVEYVQKILSEHTSGKVDHGYRIWNLMMFQLWWNHHFS